VRKAFRLRAFTPTEGLLANCAMFARPGVAADTFASSENDIAPRPRRIFVNSMSDLFHDDVPTEFVAAVWNVMEASPQHSYQILTKRPDRGMLPTWMREEMKGTKLKKDDFLIK
jgi:protein gp37